MLPNTEEISVVEENILFSDLELEVFRVRSDTPSHRGIMTFKKISRASAVILDPPPYAGENRRFLPTDVVFPSD